MLADLTTAVLWIGRTPWIVEISYYLHSFWKCTNLWTTDPGNFKGVSPVSLHVDVDLCASPGIFFIILVNVQRGMLLFSFTTLSFVCPRPDKMSERAQLNHFLPGWRRNVRHGNRIAKSIGTRGKREYVGVWGGQVGHVGVWRDQVGQVGHGVVARVDVAAHVKALWIYLPLQASGNVKIFLDIQLVTEGRVHKSSRIRFVIQWIRVKILLMFEGK